MNAKAQPLVGLYSSSTKDRYTGPVALVFANVDFDNNARGVAYALKRARKVAAVLKGKMSVALASTPDMSYELSDYGLKSNHPHSNVLMAITDGSNKYGSDAAFSGPALQTFADAFLKGDLTPYVKPDEPPPADADDEDEPPADEEEEQKEEM